MQIFRLALAILFVACSGRCVARSGAPAMKWLLIIGEEKGYRHEAVYHAAATIERLGREARLWSTTIGTDTEALAKKKLEYNAKNLNDFDAVLFHTGGELEMNGEQKAALLSFVRDDGRGFIGVHSAAITFANWPEYREMIGGFYDKHPGVTFDARLWWKTPTFRACSTVAEGVFVEGRDLPDERLVARKCAGADEAG